MTLEQRIERMKKRNEFFHDEDIALCIQLLETWQKVIDEINKEKEDAMFKPDSDFYDGVFYALGFTLGVIDKELEKVGEQDG